MLYHYTCDDHGAPGIVRTGQLLPVFHPLLKRKLVWLTDLDRPDRYALGLDVARLRCDRTRYRVTVGTATPDVTVPWWWFAREQRIPRALRDILEENTLSRHWWVSTRPLSYLDIRATETGRKATRETRDGARAGSATGRRVPRTMASS